LKRSLVIAFMKNLTFLFLYIPFILSSQEFNINLAWNDTSVASPNENIPVTLSGSDVFYSYLYDSIPYYHKRIPLNLSIELSNVNFRVDRATKLTQEEVAYLTGKSATTFSNKAEIFWSGFSENYVEIQFLPFQETDSGTIKITAFTVEFESKPAEKRAIGTVNESVLSEGNWHKIRVKNTGIYKLTYADIVAMGFSKPENIKLYGNGGKMLSKYNKDPRPTDLSEIAIYKNLGSDGVFSSGDYLLFYAEGVTAINYDTINERFTHINHEFSNYIYYFLTDSKEPATEIPVISANETAPYVSSAFDDIHVYEKERINLVLSGRLMLSEEITYSNDFDTTFNTPNKVAGEEILLTSSVVARSSSGVNFNVIANDAEVDAIYVNSVNLSSTTSNYARRKISYKNVNISGDNIKLELDFLPTNTTDRAWVDFFRVQARRDLQMVNSTLIFRDAQSTNYNYTQYRLSQTEADYVVWNVSDINAIYAPQKSFADNVTTFTDSSSELQTYIAFNPSANYPKPEYISNGKDIGPVENQNLHGVNNCELLIVTPPEFLLQAEELADLHRSTDGMNVCVLTTFEIYNEYSSGIPDASAIRDLAVDLYLKSLGGFKYLLLYGDGSVYNLLDHPNNTNFIPTYQSVESLNQLNTLMTDDFFGMLDFNEGEDIGSVDIGIGRIPITDTLEGRAVLDKTYSYYNNLRTQKWHNNITFIGDDEDGNIHMTDADDFAEKVENLKPEFSINKLYLDAFEQVSSSNGSRYPAVNDAFDAALLKGQLIVNYSGHGGIRGLAHERILTNEQVENWNNKDKYPIFITATCELSAFDHVDNSFLKKEKTVGERIFLKEEGGAIAMFTTTRVVFAYQNRALNSAFYNHVFEKDESGDYYRLGDIIKETKRDVVNDNTLKFALLGNPALPLACATYHVITDSINGSSTHTLYENDTLFLSDTLNALERIIIHGHIQNNMHQLARYQLQRINLC
jgi:hypothetical protein